MSSTEAMVLIAIGSVIVLLPAFAFRLEARERRSRTIGVAPARQKV
jgi:hypothetical protein